ncbi:MAG: hypothetical protein DBY09_06055 [Selenomonadales bacterium]|nr:MAG: hypothetical protein DBY09_06055 [Selenomonadales bacterium]
MAAPLTNVRVCLLSIIRLLTKNNIRTGRLQAGKKGPCKHIKGRKAKRAVRLCVRIIKYYSITRPRQTRAFAFFSLMFPLKRGERPDKKTGAARRARPFRPGTKPAHAG